MVITEPVEITSPGVYDIPADDYHADPVKGGSLSSTGARRLLEVTPKRWRYEQEHPVPPTPAMILGTAVHTFVLGAGQKVERIEADNYQTKAAKAARDEAKAAGAIPLLRDDYDTARAMADAVLTHEVGGKLFDPARGTAEQALIWFDAEFGIWRRSLVDHLPHESAQRPILADLKTTVDAGRRALSKTVANFGYHQQAPFYLDGYEALFPGSDPAFLLVFVEKTGPHEVSVVELDRPALIVGAERNRRAMSIYAECRATGRWPGLSPEIELVSLPAWASARLEEPF